MSLEYVVPREMTRDEVTVLERIAKGKGFFLLEVHRVAVANARSTLSYLNDLLLDRATKIEMLEAQVQKLQAENHELVELKEVLDGNHLRNCGVIDDLRKTLEVSKQSQERTQGRLDKAREALVALLQHAREGVDNATKGLENTKST